MIGERIYDDDPYWNNFVLLLTIVDYVLAPVVSKDCIDYLRVLIDDHHQSFKALYPNCHLTPKMHYLVHYPDYTNRFGLLVRCWCMRFNYFKDLAHRVKSFKNILKTMAMRHQHLVAYHTAIGYGSNPFCKEATTGIVSEALLSSLDYKDELLNTMADISEDSKIKMFLCL